MARWRFSKGVAPEQIDVIDAVIAALWAASGGPAAIAPTLAASNAQFLMGVAREWRAAQDETLHKVGKEGEEELKFTRGDARMYFAWAGLAALFESLAAKKKGPNGDDDECDDEYALEHIHDQLALGGVITTQDAIEAVRAADPAPTWRRWIRDRGGPVAAARLMLGRVSPTKEHHLRGIDKLVAADAPESAMREVMQVARADRDVDPAIILTWVLEHLGVEPAKRNAVVSDLFGPQPIRRPMPRERQAMSKAGIEIPDE